MTIFFRLLETDDKATALHQAIQQLAQKQPNPITFAVEPESFQQVPGAPFAYWVNEEIREIFQGFERLGNKQRTVKQGLATADDFRFLRVLWESPLLQEDIYLSFAKGGAFSQFYADISLEMRWSRASIEIANSLNDKGKVKSNIWMLEDTISLFFQRPGLTYSRRSQKGLSIRVMPQGCIFADKGPAIFVEKDDSEQLLILLAITNSAAFRLLVELQMAFGSYEVGVIQRTPVPDFTPESITTLANLARRAWLLKRGLDTVTQTSHAFVLPSLLQVSGSSLSQRAKIWSNKITAIETELAQIQTQIDELVFDLYGINEEVGSMQQAEGSEQLSELPTNPPTAYRELPTDEDEDDNSAIADLPFLVSELLAYVVSVAFGRFDVRLATGDSLRDGKAEREFPSEPEPFDPLPVCSPGMLVGENGLPPTARNEVPAGYPIQIPFDGILVDDEGHPIDIIRHIRQVLKVIWGEKDSDIEQEACELLSTNSQKVSSLRDYFRKPAAFFNDHLSRYSKSRRQAPIYLPLSTASGSYTLWLYYHRLTDQTLYTCINDYIEPKLGRVSETVKFLRSKTTRTRDEDNDLENLQTLEDELTKFRDELLRVAKLPWNPNLNDGVQITVAPLHSLFRLSKWQKKLKETWDKLEKGDYDWAHLAHSIWTARVREKCRTDKSLAIAHGLENLYEPPPETPKRTKLKSKQ
jgi:hypothetical protein